MNEITEPVELEFFEITAEKRAEIWLKENKEAIESWNLYVEKNGLPLEKYRNF